MNTEKELEKVAEKYRGDGYQVILHPAPSDLPLFAADFKIDMVAARKSDHVLVQVKETREEVEADPDVSRYAETTNAQPGWRFDLVILKSESPMARALRGAAEPSEEQLSQTLAEAEALAEQGRLRPAALIAWGTLEAAMRRRLFAAGEKIGWGTSPREMLNELYSAGVFSDEEFSELEKAMRLRNEVAHGFASPALNAQVVQALIGLARRLFSESQPVAQHA